MADGSWAARPSTARRCRGCCATARLHRVLTKGRSAILDYGTATRTIPANLWNALVIRDEHCRFPGCDRTSSWCEGHHVRWVTHGGATEINNLVAPLLPPSPPSSTQPDWQAKLLPDATFEVTDPNGMVRATSHRAGGAGVVTSVWTPTVGRRRPATTPTGGSAAVTPSVSRA